MEGTLVATTTNNCGGTLWNMWFCYTCNQYHSNGTLCPQFGLKIPVWIGGNVATTDIRPSQIVVEKDKDKDKITVTVKTADGAILNTLVLSADQAANLKKQL